MGELPEAFDVPVMRVDYSDDGVWEWVKHEIAAPTDEGFFANVDFVDGPSLDGWDEAAIVARYPRAYPDDYRHPVLFVVDGLAVSAREHPILVVNLNARVEVGPFRTLPREVQSIENNLSLANMDYEEFASATDAHGVFRGF